MNNEVIEDKEQKLAPNEVQHDETLISMTPILDRFEKDFYQMVDQFDENLKILRDEDKSRQGQRYWLDLMIKPLFPGSVKNIYSWLRITLFVAATFFPSNFFVEKLFKDVGISEGVLTAICVLVLLLISYTVATLHFKNRMSTFGDPLFHIDAYRKNRVQEYKLYSPFLDEKGSFLLKELRDELKKAEQKYMEDSKSYIVYIEDSWKVQEEQTKKLVDRNEQLLSEINLLSFSLFSAMDLIEKSHNSEIDKFDLKLFEGIEFYKLDGLYMTLLETVASRGVVVNPLKITEYPNSPHVQILGAEDFVRVIDDGIIFRYDDGDDTFTARLYVSPQMLETLKNQENYDRFNLGAIYDLTFASFKLFQEQKKGAIKDGK